MNYKQFIDAMFACTKRCVTDDVTIEKQEVPKNNGVVFKGLSIRYDHHPIAPVIYLEDLYEKWEALAQ